MSGEPGTQRVTYAEESRQEGVEQQVRVSIRMKAFDLPPVRDGVLVGRRAAIGPRALFEALDRMLPGTFELLPIDGHPIIEAAIVRKTRLMLVPRDRLITVLLRYAQGLMHEPGIVQFEMEGEISVQFELSRSREAG